jgi:chromosome segregation ATPase
MKTPGTPSGAMDAVPPPEPDLSLERGFVASLRWLVAEGNVRGVRRIAVELRALQEALATLDETRAARDEQARRAADLDDELQTALAMLGPGTAVDTDGSLVQRLVRLRERLAQDKAARQQTALERDAWRAMCTLLTQTRAGMYERLGDIERERDEAAARLDVMRERVVELTALHDDAVAQSVAAKQELATLRSQLRQGSGTVERALAELTREARELAD